MKILTWNMQGYLGRVEKPVILEELLNSGEYDIICIQEGGRPLESFELRRGLNYVEICNMIPPEYPRECNHIHEYTALYHEWGVGNNRCSLVTYVKTHLWRHNNTWIERSSMEGTRPMLCLRLNNGAVIGNIHLISGNEDAARHQLTEFQNALIGECYCIFGDFNINALMYDMDNGYYHVHTSTQIGGACLDYLYSPNFTPTTFRKETNEGEYSDHAMVSYSIPKLV